MEVSGSRWVDGMGECKWVGVGVVQLQSFFMETLRSRLKLKLVIEIFKNPQNHVQPLATTYNHL